MAKIDGSGASGARRQRVILAYSQSNFRNVAPHRWSPPPNLFVFDGGMDGTLGTAFRPCPDDEMRVPYAILGEMAEADPDTDYHLLICATGGVGVRAVVGLPYRWSASVSGDPGPGAIGLDSAAPDEAGLLRYSASDADGHLRFRDGTDLAVTTASKRQARIVIGDQRRPLIRFRTLGPGNQIGGYRTQAIAVTACEDWPPPEGTRVSLFPAQENLRSVIQRNARAAFDALGRDGGDRVFDLVLIWPTESDVGYYKAYAASDHDRLIGFLSRWTNEATRFVYTLPWPHHPDPKVAATIRRWWAEIERIVAAAPARRVLARLEGSAVTDWRDLANIHTGDGASKVRIGRMIAEAARRGGIDLSASAAPPATPPAARGRASALRLWLGRLGARSRK